MRKHLLILITASLMLSGCATSDLTDSTESAAIDIESEIESVEVDESSTEELETAPNPYLPIVAEPFNDSWPTDFRRSEAIGTALFKNFEFFDSRIDSECSHSANIFFQRESTSDDHVEKISDAMMRIFCEELAGDIWLIVGDYPYLKEKIAELELEADEFGGICGIENPVYNTGCALFRTAWVKQDVTDTWLRNLAAHEIFHLVQDSISPDPPSWRTAPGSPIRIPNWITEGSATYFAAALNSYLGPDTYGDHLGSSIELLPDPKTDIDLSSSVMADGFTSEVYNVGQFATEYLVANSGFESYMNLWFSRDLGLDFSEGISESFGISLEELYEITSNISLSKESGQ